MNERTRLSCRRRDGKPYLNRAGDKYLGGEYHDGTRDEP